MTPRRTALALLAALALLGAGCGKDSEKGKPIPSSNVTELQKQLDAIEARFNHGDGACGDITSDSEPAVSQALDQIPSSVDRKVRESLRQSFDHLFRLSADQCDTTPTDTNTETNTTPTETQQSTPTETQKTETQQTQPEQTQTEATPPGEQKPKNEKKPKENNGNGGGPAAPGQGQ
jgi:outer membrane biosynthesis protein TonB